MNFGAWVFIGILIVGLIFAIKSKRITMLETSLFIAITLLLYLLDYLFDSDMLSPFTFNKDSLTINFLGIILVIVTFLLVKYVLDRIISKKTR